MSDALDEALKESFDDEPIKRRSRGNRARHVSEAEELLSGEANDIEKKDLKELYQWSIMGGGRYAPCGDTVHTLKPGMYTPMATDRGFYFQRKEISTDDILMFPDTKSEMIIQELEKFWERKQYFDKYGFLHKRGFLLYGPPGSGKTITVTMAANKLIEQGGFVLFGTKINVIVKGLEIIRQIEPERRIICILEDLDDIVENQGEAELLALLDGEHQVDNIVYIATTNYINKLDKRFTNRPSRFDQAIHIDMPSKEARRIYFEKKLGPIPELDKWVEISHGFGFAHMREMIVSVMCLDGDITDVAERLRGMNKHKDIHHKKINPLD